MDRHCSRVIALSPSVVLCTSDAEGNRDAWPRGGEAGFCKVADDHTLLLPDRPGNNRLDSFSNIIGTGRVGLTGTPGVSLAAAILPTLGAYRVSVLELLQSR